tara:strand:+ start:2988 stop:3092 length:105 start_codon:yes stop_codon:yes gene_type:complete
VNQIIETQNEKLRELLNHKKQKQKIILNNVKTPK